MFTDIKNSRNIIENNCTGSCNHAQSSSNNNNNNNNKDKKMKKLWQPLKRLVTLQKVISFNKSNNNNSAIASIPNNVYLNNAASIIVRPAEQEEHEGEHESPTVLDNKLPLDDRLSKSSEEEIIKSSPASAKPDIFIHSASIEKTVMGACTSCVYGKNCQHFGLHSDNASEELDIFLLSELPPPTDSQTQHLREWLKYNSWQMAKNLSY